MPNSTISQQSTELRNIPTMPEVALEARELTTKSVVVYQDRAEVKRAILVQRPEQFGQNAGKMLIRINVSKIVEIWGNPNLPKKVASKIKIFLKFKTEHIWDFKNQKFQNLITHFSECLPNACP